MTEKLILLSLWKCLFFRQYNDTVKFIANKSKNKTILNFVGVLAGGNLEFPNDVIDESLEQLSWDIKSKKLQEILWL